MKGYIFKVKYKNEPDEEYRLASFVVHGNNDDDAIKELEKSVQLWISGAIEWEWYSVEQIAIIKARV